MNFEKQELTVSNLKWEIELLYESHYHEDKHMATQAFDNIVHLSGEGDYSSSLSIKTIDRSNATVKRLLVKGINGGCYLSIADQKEKGCTLKLIEDHLYFSLGFILGSLHIPSQQMEWTIKPDRAEIFEFYDLDGDLLVRGELEIHRVGRDGVVKWSYGGKDIWVNMNGEEEVLISEDKIFLTDFDGNKYIIDFDGRTIGHYPAY